MVRCGAKRWPAAARYFAAFPSHGRRSDACAALDFYGLQPGGTPRDDPRLGDVTAQLAADLTFHCPAVVVSKALATRGMSVWQYQFDFAGPGGIVGHGSESVTSWTRRCQERRRCKDIG